MEVPGNIACETKSSEEANAEVTCSADGVCKLYKGKNDSHSKFAFVARVRETDLSDADGFENNVLLC